MVPKIYSVVLSGGSVKSNEYVKVVMRRYSADENVSLSAGSSDFG